jgi:hypothetical protein
LCKDTINDHYVLIENQLERTDHTHLGQLMTYAAGLEAVTIIWIAQKFTEEHRAALDWLNRITDDTFNFFGIEIELVKIGDSVPAPIFNLVSKPNDWSKQVKQSASQNVSDTKMLQMEYFQALKDYLEERKCSFKIQKPAPQNFSNISIGKSNLYLSTTISSRDNSINIWLNIQTANAKETFERLYQIAHKDSLSAISPNLIWDSMEGRKMSAVILKTTGDFTDKKDWQKQFEWFRIYLEKYVNFFRPIIARV